MNHTTHDTTVQTVSGCVAKATSFAQQQFKLILEQRQHKLSRSGNKKSLHSGNTIKIPRSGNTSFYAAATQILAQQQHK